MARDRRQLISERSPDQRSEIRGLRHGNWVRSWCFTGPSVFTMRPKIRTSHSLPDIVSLIRAAMQYAWQTSARAWPRRRRKMRFHRRDTKNLNRPEKEHPHIDDVTRLKY